VSRKELRIGHPVFQRPALRRAFYFAASINSAKELDILFLPPGLALAFHFLLTAAPRSPPLRWPR